MSDSQRYLELKVVSAREVHTKNKTPVYCEVHFREQTFRTKAVKGAENARWDQTFFLGHFETSDSIQISCLTKFKAAESDVGHVLLPLSDFDHEGVFEREVSLEQSSEQDCSGGVIMVEIHVSQEARQANKRAKAVGGGFFFRIRMLFRRPKKLSERHSADPHEMTDNEAKRDSKRLTKTYSSPTVNSEPAAKSGVVESPSMPAISPKAKLMPTAPTDGAEAAPVDNSQRLFGVALSELLERQRDEHPELRVPLFVHEAVQFIRRKGLHTLGVFRIRGKLAEIKELKEQLDRGQTIDFEKIDNIHSITTLLKQFLRELPEPLLTFELCDEFVECTQLNGDEQIERIRENLHKIPRCNFQLLKVMMEVARDTSLRAEENKMTSENLATVLSPNLLWRETIDITNLAMVDEAKKIGTLTHLLIVNYETFFGAESATSTSSSSSSPRVPSAAAENAPALALKDN